MGISFFGGGGGGSGAGIQKVADAAALALLTPSEGDFAIQLDTDTLYYYNGAAWVIYLDDSSYAALVAVVAGLAAHLADTTDAHAASAITFTPASGITATEVQSAIVEALTDSIAYTDLHINDTSAAHAASAIAVTPAGNLAASTAAAAFTELQGDIDTLTAASHAAVTLAAFGSTPNANGLTLTTQALNMQPADETNPGGVSTAAQVFGGEKRLPGGINVGSNAALNASSTMSVISTTKGSIPMPVMTTAQRVAIATPATGLMVYDSDLAGPMSYDGTQWQSMDGRAVVAAAQTPADAATLTPLGYRNQILPISGSGGAVTLANVAGTNAKDGDVMTLIGTSDTNTVTVVSATNVALNGSATLGLDSTLSLKYYSSKWRETGRS